MKNKGLMQEISNKRLNPTIFPANHMKCEGLMQKIPSCRVCIALQDGAFYGFSVTLSFAFEEVCHHVSALFCENSGHHLCLWMHQGRGEAGETAFGIRCSVDHGAYL